MGKCPASCLLLTGRFRKLSRQTKLSVRSRFNGGPCVQAQPAGEPSAPFLSDRKARVFFRQNKRRAGSWASAPRAAFFLPGDFGNCPAKRNFQSAPGATAGRACRLSLPGSRPRPFFRIERQGCFSGRTDEGPGRGQVPRELPSSYYREISETTHPLTPLPRGRFVKIIGPLGAEGGYSWEGAAPPPCHRPPQRGKAARRREMS